MKWHLGGGGHGKSPSIFFCRVTPFTVKVCLLEQVTVCACICKLVGAASEIPGLVTCEQCWSAPQCNSRVLRYWTNEEAEAKGVAMTETFRPQQKVRQYFELNEQCRRKLA